MRFRQRGLSTETGRSGGHTENNGMAAITNEELSPLRFERQRLEIRQICNADSLRTALLTVARFHLHALTVVGFCGAAGGKATSKTRGIAYG
jgi:hypothetical protein